MKMIKKIFKIIKKIIITILAIIYFSFVLAMSMLLLNYNKLPPKMPTFRAQLSN